MVSTVELTETDAHIDLPPPMSLREMESMTLAQKRMAAMIMEVEGEGDSDEENDKSSSSKRKKDTGLVDLGLRGGETVNAEPVKAGEEKEKEDADEDMEMDESDDEQAEKPMETIPTTSTSNPQVKIRKDYVPKTLAERQATSSGATTLCPVCGLSVPIEEMAEHVRIELLNPRYTQQRSELESKKAQHAALHEGADPSKFLRHLASNRTDVFGSEAEEVLREKREEEENRKRREREKMVWDGHINSAKSTRETFNKNVNQEEVYADMERRRKAAEASAIGPQAIPPSGPRFQNSSVLPNRPGSGHVGSPAPTGSIPSSSTGSPAPIAGQKRPAEGELADQPPVQRAAIGSPAIGSPAIGSPAPHHHSESAQQVTATAAPPSGAPTGPKADILEKLSDGSLHPEKDWISSHPNPISIQINLPEATAISSKCDGSTVTFDQLPPTSTIGSIRDRVQAEYLEGKVGASKLKVKVNGKAATLKQTLGHWNLVEGDLVEVILNK